MSQNPYLTTKEVGLLLRIKDRKVYELVAAQAIPYVKVTGKLLFPRVLIDAWLLRHVEYNAGVESLQPLPFICSGSHDPLLDWALREANSGIAVNFTGSLNGLRSLERHRSMMAGIHLREAGSEPRWNNAYVQQQLPGQPVVSVHWAMRQQGFIVAPDNPLQISEIAHLPSARVIGRQPAAGAYVLMKMLLDAEDLAEKDIHFVQPHAKTDADVAMAVADGIADVGLGIAAVAKQYRLDFIPITPERYDLVVWQSAYFGEAFQRLLAFTRSDLFHQRAQQLGYDTSQTGRIEYHL